MRRLSPRLGICVNLVLADDIASISDDLTTLFDKAKVRDFRGLQYLYINDTNSGHIQINHTHLQDFQSSQRQTITTHKHHHSKKKRKNVKHESSTMGRKALLRLSPQYPASQDCSSTGCNHSPHKLCGMHTVLQSVHSERKKSQDYKAYRSQLLIVTRSVELISISSEAGMTWWSLRL